MQIIKLNKNILYSLTIIIVILLGVYFCFVGGYGSDEDTLPMIYVFEARLSDGRFVSSRFTSYPIPEIGIGFLSYFFETVNFLPKRYYTSFKLSNHSSQ